MAIGAQALGRACFRITSLLDAPDKTAIWIYGLANKLIMAARVILIMCAIITKVRVKAGSAHLKRRSANKVVSSTFAKVGKIGHNDPNNNIKIYATKNSGNEIVVSEAAFTARS